MPQDGRGAAPPAPDRERRLDGLSLCGPPSYRQDLGQYRGVPAMLAPVVLNTRRRKAFGLGSRGGI